MSLGQDYTGVWGAFWLVVKVKPGLWVDCNPSWEAAVGQRQLIR